MVAQGSLSCQKSPCFSLSSVQNCSAGLPYLYFVIGGCALVLCAARARLACFLIASVETYIYISHTF